MFQRREKVKARICLIAEGEKNTGFINYIDEDGTKKFADFKLVDYDPDTDTYSAGSSEIFTKLEKAFDSNTTVTLVLTRVNSEHDLVIAVEDM